MTGTSRDRKRIRLPTLRRGTVAPTTGLRERVRAADLRLFRKISGWRSRPLWWSRSKSPTHAERLMLWLSLAANMSRIWFAYAAIFFRFGGRSGKRAAVRGLCSIGATSAIINFVVKPVVKRQRPARDHIPAARQLVRAPLSASFPSGHAASGFAFLTGVLLESRRAGAVVAPVAAGVAYSRAFNGVHYPLDVASGAIIGSAVGLAGRILWPAMPRPDGGHAELPVRRAAPASADGSDVTLLLNPDAGPGTGPALLSAAQLHDLLPAAEIVELAEEQDPLEVASAIASSAEVIGVCGGNGTLAAAAEAAADHRKPLLIIPCGTMNHLAHDLGIRDPGDAIAALRRGEAVEIDVATIDGRAFVNQASVGVHTALVQERRRLPRWLGRWAAQVVAALRVMREVAPLQLLVDGERRSIWMGFFGNGTYHGCGIAPGWRHSLSAGTLDIRLLDAERHPSRLRVMIALLLGALRGSGGIERTRSQRMTLEAWGRPLRVVRDGETFEAGGRILVESHPRRLLVYVPEAGSSGQPRARKSARRAVAPT